MLFIYGQHGTGCSMELHGTGCCKYELFWADIMLKKFISHALEVTKPGFS
jgi:hypothetical protein